MVDPDIIIKRLEKLKSYLHILKKLKKMPEKRFVEDPFIYGVADRFLHLAIECLIDIGNHIISDQNFKKPDSYSEIFDILYEEQVIPKSLYLKIVNMAAFRNILVHDYLDIDHIMVYDVIQNKIPYLEKLAAVFAKFI